MEQERFPLPIPASEIYEAQFPKLMSLHIKNCTIPAYVNKPPVLSVNTFIEMKIPDVRATVLSQSSQESVPITRPLISKSKAYRKRNVYKSIVRHMHSYFRENAMTMCSILEKNGFGREEIEKAFQSVKELSERERLKGKPKRPKSILHRILSSKNIYVYILKEALWTMMKNWAINVGSKVSKENIEIYKEVCCRYYSKCTVLIAKTNIAPLNIL
eukprot:TRINITY_DN249_c0_g2_i3.p1 TRINITY_DN249_c0_g2~~TRINITY_DN249_c0_g2_i3.p1  ORF type:complete len:215 (+),score=25.51 TRINITY_DN249_c0_g2_i3:455-1099(+)